MPASAANNVSEMMTALVSEVAGTTLFAYVIGALVSIVLNLDPETRLRKQKVCPVFLELHQ